MEPVPEPVRPAEPGKPAEPPEPARIAGQAAAAEEGAVARSVSARIKAAGLPKNGNIRFVPPRGYDGDCTA